MTTVVSNILVAVATAFIVSAGSTLAIGWKDQAVDSKILQQNTDAIKELTAVVRDLQVNQAIFTERYVPRSELEQRLKEKK